MKNLEYELATVQKVELANKELGKQIAIITNAIRMGKNAQWDVVFAVNEILAEELWEDDFDTQKEFAEFMNLSNASISQYKGALLFLKATGISYDKLSVGNAYLLSTFVLADEEKGVYDVQEYVEFEEWCKANGIDLLNLTQKSLRNAIADFKSKDSAVDDEIEDEAGESESTEDSEKIGKANVTIHVGDNRVEYTLNDEQIEKVIKFIEAMNENK